jgi:hypothetical protein
MRAVLAVENKATAPKIFEYVIETVLATSISGASLLASFSDERSERALMLTKIYKMVAMITLMRIARGRSFSGFLASSARFAIFSKPKKEKMISALPDMVPR